MAAKFDEIVEVFANEHYKQKFKRTVSDTEKEQIINILKSETSDAVLKEIRAELSTEIEKEIRTSIEEENRLAKLSDLTKFIFEGFVIALLVGLLVNQITELISYYKGASPELPYISTWIITIVLSAICSLILFVGFVREFTKMYNNYVKGKNHNAKD